MIIAIDANEANVTHPVGIGRYAYELIRHLYKIREKRNDTTSFQIYLKDIPIRDLPKENSWWKMNIVGPKPLWTQFGLPLRLMMTSPKPDVFFTPSHYAPRFSPSPTVISIMDLSYIHFPNLFKQSDLYQLRNWTNYSIKKAKKILTISNFTKQDISSYYQIDPENIVVTYPGYDQTIFHTKYKQSEIEETKKKYSIKNDFILYVGTIQPRKNIEVLLEAFNKLKQTMPTISLVLVGKKGWLYDEIILKAKDINDDRIRFTDYVTETELARLYNGASCFILPSLYEGFGLTVVEAMACGCPTIVSNVSSLPEIAGDTCSFIDPQNTNDVVSQMESVLKNKKLQDRLREKGLKRAKLFSWTDCAQKTYDVLKKAGGNYV